MTGPSSQPPRGPRAGITGAAAGLCALAICLAQIPSGDADAADFSVEAETIGQAYQLRGRDGLFTIPRSRITQLLNLWGTDLLGRASDLHAPKSLDISLSLSLDHDFGVVGSHLDPHDPASFVPLLDRTEVGLLTGQFSGRFGLDPAFRFQIGRMVVLDPAGFLAMDGAVVGLEALRLIEVQVGFGWELVPDLRLTVFDFAPEGVSWGKREGWPSDEIHPEIRAPRPRPTVLASFTLELQQAGSLTLSYRRTWSDPEFDRVALERLGLGLDVHGHDRIITANLRAAFDLVWLEVAELDAEVRLQPLGHLGFGVRFTHMLPLFDSASIFNVFEVDPHDEVGLFFKLGKARESLLTLAVGSSVRLTDVSVYETDEDRFSDLSAWLLIALRRHPLQMSWSIRGSGGDSGFLAGSRIQASLSLLQGRLLPTVGLGLWSWNDPLRREHHGLTVGGSTMLAWRPVEQFSVIAGLDVYDNRVSGTGLSATVRMLVRI